MLFTLYPEGIFVNMGMNYFLVFVVMFKIAWDFLVKLLISESEKAPRLNECHRAAIRRTAALYCRTLLSYGTLLYYRTLLSFFLLFPLHLLCKGFHDFQGSPQSCCLGLVPAGFHEPGILPKGISG